MTDTLYRLREKLDWVESDLGGVPVMEARTVLGSYFYYRDVRAGWRYLTPFAKDGWVDSASPDTCQSAAEAHYRARMADGLVPVEALGTPELTVDGCLICSNTEELWLIHNGEVRRVDRTQDGSWMCFTDGDDEDPPCPWPLHERCYSTRAAAEAAKKEPTK